MKEIRSRAINLVLFLTFSLSLSGLTACTWVKPSEAGAAISVLEPEEVVGCDRLGQTTAMSKDKIAGIKRSASKLKLELTTIAQNRAATMGGNTISPTGPVTGSEQTFTVYRCQ